MNMALKARTGRLLARCHAALGEHTLCTAALDAALAGTREGLLLYSEALTVRARALVGIGNATANGSTHTHWTAAVGKQRLAEVMGRMESSRRDGLLEKLLLAGIP